MKISKCKYFHKIMSLTTCEVYDACELYECPCESKECQYKELYAEIDRLKDIITFLKEQNKKARLRESKYQSAMQNLKNKLVKLTNSLTIPPQDEEESFTIYSASERNAMYHEALREYGANTGRMYIKVDGRTIYPNKENS